MSNLTLSSFVKRIAKRNNIKLGTIYNYSNNTSYQEKNLVANRMLAVPQKQRVYDPINTLEAIQSYLKDKESES